MSVIESEREIDEEVMSKYLPDYQPSKLPMLYEKPLDEATFNTEREILYKVLFDMKTDMNDLKRLVLEMMQSGVESPELHENHAQTIEKLYQNVDVPVPDTGSRGGTIQPDDDTNIQDTEEIIEESLSLEEKEIELIKKALNKHMGKRKYAAEELGISERTLYRKIKEYDLE